MTHEQRMKAVIEVGERATPQHWSYEDDRDSAVAVSKAHSDTLGPLERWDADLFGNFYHAYRVYGFFLKRDDAEFCAQAANARETFALAAEIVKAAGECRKLDEACVGYDGGSTDEDVIGDVRCNRDAAYAALDALLAKWKEAKDA